MTKSNNIVAHVVLCPDNVQVKRIMLALSKDFTYKDFIVHVFNLEPDIFKDKSYIDTIICYAGKTAAPYTPNFIEELGITDIPTFPIYLFYKKHNFINLLNDSKSSWGNKELALDWLEQYCEEGSDLRDDTPYGFDEWCDNLEYHVKDYNIRIIQESGTTPYYRSLSTR